MSNAEQYTNFGCSSPERYEDEFEKELQGFSYGKVLCDKFPYSHARAFSPMFLISHMKTCYAAVVSKKLKELVSL